MNEKSPRYFTEHREKELPTLHPQHEQLISAVLSAIPRVEIRVWAWLPSFDKYENRRMIRVPGHDYALAWGTQEQWQETECQALRLQVPVSRGFAWFWAKEGIEPEDTQRFEHEYTLALDAVQNCLKAEATPHRPVEPTLTDTHAALPYPHKAPRPRGLNDDHTP